MYEQFPEVMNMLWARMLKDNKKNWRRVYKVCHRFFISKNALLQILSQGQWVWFLAKILDWVQSKLVWRAMNSLTFML